MVTTAPLTDNEKKLMKRYLVWCYKTTKEQIDKIDRYYTQIKVDHFILEALHNLPEHQFKNDGFQKNVDEFKVYIEHKQNNVDKKKFNDANKEELNPEYQYLQARIKCIEDAIVHFLGEDQLIIIQELYEKEMTQRILQAKDHH